MRACADRISLHAAQAVPVGLIVNEAVTNALKHAFPGERQGAVTVRLRRHGESRLRLEIADDGVGLPGSDAGAPGGSGTRLVRLLARQLDGHAAWHARPGTTVVVTFPEAQPDQPPSEAPALADRSGTSQRRLLSGSVGLFQGGAVRR